MTGKSPIDAIGGIVAGKSNPVDFVNNYRKKFLEEKVATNAAPQRNFSKFPPLPFASMSNGTAAARND